MNEKTAVDTLGPAIQEDNALYDLGWYLSWHGGDDIIMDGNFSPDDLEAIAWWTKNKIYPKPKDNEA